MLLLASCRRSMMKAAVTPALSVPQMPIQYQPLASAMTALFITTPAPAPRFWMNNPVEASKSAANALVSVASRHSRSNLVRELALTKQLMATFSPAVIVMGCEVECPFGPVADSTSASAVVVPSGDTTAFAVMELLLLVHVALSSVSD